MWPHLRGTSRDQAAWSHCAQALAGTTHVCRRHAVIHCVQACGWGELTTERVEAYVNKMSSWMRKNKLQLNDSKTVLCTTTQRLTSPISRFGDSEIQPVSVVRNIGAELDETLSMRSHVNSLCSRAHFYLRNISKIRHLLDRRTTATLVHAYVTSRLDNGKALLCGLLKLCYLRCNESRTQLLASCVWLANGST